MKKYIFFIPALLLMALCLSSCDEQEYTWKPEASAQTTQANTDTGLTTARSSSVYSSDGQETQFTGGKASAATSQTPLGDQEEEQFKDEMNAILDELMGVD